MPALTNSVEYSPRGPYQYSKKKKMDHAFKRLEVKLYNFLYLQTTLKKRKY